MRRTSSDRPAANIRSARRSRRCVERLARRVEPEFEGAVAVQGVAALGEELGHGAAREQADLQRAHDLGDVVGVDARGGAARRSGASRRCERAGAAALARGQALAQRFVALGPGEQAVEQGAQIEPRAAGDHGQAPRAAISASTARPRRAYSPAVNTSSGSAISIKWCGIPRISAGGKLGGADIEVAIDLQRIAVDHFAARTGSGDQQMASSLLPEPVGPTTATRGRCGAAVQVACVPAGKPPLYNEMERFDPPGHPKCQGRKKANRMTRSAKPAYSGRRVGSCCQRRRQTSPAKPQAPDKRPKPTTTSPWATSTRNWPAPTGTGAST